MKITYKEAQVIRGRYQVDNSESKLVFFENEDTFGDLAMTVDGTRYGLPIKTREQAEEIVQILQHALKKVPISGAA